MTEALDRRTPGTASGGYEEGHRVPDHSGALRVGRIIPDMGRGLELPTVLPGTLAEEAAATPQAVARPEPVIGPSALDHYAGTGVTPIPPTKL